MFGQVKGRSYGYDYPRGYESPRNDYPRGGGYENGNDDDYYYYKADGTKAKIEDATDKKELETERSKR